MPTRIMKESTSGDFSPIPWIDYDDVSEMCYYKGQKHSWPQLQLMH